MTAEAAQPPTRPLPIRPRPVSGETTFSYIRRLAVANHMRPLHLRRYLKDPGPGGGFRLGWLAALAGRPVLSLQHALADQEPPAGTASRRPPDSRQRKRSKAELFTLIRRDAREHGLSARALADKHGTGKRIVRQALRSPHPAPRKPQPLRRSRIDPFTEIIDGMLEAEMQAFPPKPRPVISIYRDLVTRHGADDVSYQMVRKYVGRRRPVMRHQPLSPAHQAVADHGLDRLRDPPEKPVTPGKPRVILNAVASNGPFSGQSGDGWQQRTLPVLAGLAAEDARIRGFRAHGSASGSAASADRWSDLDVMITAMDPVTVAEDFARQIGFRLSPVFAASRSGDISAHCVRLVLRDLRRIDITASAPAGDEQGPAPAGRSRDPAEAAAELAGSFQFDAVLAAVKAARGDVLIGAHLTLQLARHILVIAMLLRDRDAGTAHHRFGGSRWDVWASRLAQAPAPYTPAGIAAAIRSYATMLDEILAGWDPQLQLDNSPLFELLDAVDQCSTPYGDGR